MSKLNIGVGEEFPLADDAKQSADSHPCAQYWRHRRHRHAARGIGAIVILPAAAASVTAAILYPLTTLGLIGGLGVLAAAHRHGRWQRYRDAYRNRRDDGPRDDGPKADEPPRNVPPAGPKENA